MPSRYATTHVLTWSVDVTDANGRVPPGLSPEARELVGKFVEQADELLRGTGVVLTGWPKGDERLTFAVATNDRGRKDRSPMQICAEALAPAVTAVNEGWAADRRLLTYGPTRDGLRLEVGSALSDEVSNADPAVVATVVTEQPMSRAERQSFEDGLIANPKLWVRQVVPNGENGATVFAYPMRGDDDVAVAVKATAQRAMPHQTVTVLSEGGGTSPVNTPQRTGADIARVQGKTAAVSGRR